MSSGERPMGAAKGKQSDTEALCQIPCPPPELKPRLPRRIRAGLGVPNDDLRHRRALGLARRGHMAAAGGEAHNLVGVPVELEPLGPQCALQQLLLQRNALHSGTAQVGAVGAMAGRKLLCKVGVTRGPIFPTPPHLLGRRDGRGGSGRGCPTCRAEGGAQNDTHVALIILTTQMWGGKLLVEKTFSGQNLCSCSFGANIRSYTKQRARHGTPFLQPPPLLRRAPMSPPPPLQSNFQVAHLVPLGGCRCDTGYVYRRPHPHRRLAHLPAV